MGFKIFSQLPVAKRVLIQESHLLNLLLDYGATDIYFIGLSSITGLVDLFSPYHLCIVDDFILEKLNFYFKLSQCKGAKMRNLQSKIKLGSEISNI